MGVTQGVEAIEYRTDAETLARYGENVSALRRSIRGVVFPRSTEEVRAVVMRARSERTPLYPISTGANWGLGSRLPVRDGCWIVDLRHMARIHGVDERHGVAIIEPGVTQRALHQKLVESRSRYFLNVTGSGADTSILGNAMDRGIAHYGPRADEVHGLEVVLGTGECLLTGTGGRSACRTTHLYRHGLGPDLEGMFFQSNLGIVTRAGIRLRRRPEVQGILRCALGGGGSLVSLVDGLADLVQQGVLQPAVHIANEHRGRSVLGGLLAQRHGRRRAQVLLGQAGIGPWSLSCPVGGTPAQVDAAVGEAVARLRELGKVRFETRLASQPEPLRPGRGQQAARALSQAGQGSFDHSLGIPSDAALASICWPVDDATYVPGKNLDATRAGTLFVVPILPMEGEAVREVVSLTETVARQHGLTPYVTFNSASALSLEGVINFLFRRDCREQAEASHACASALIDQLGGLGYMLGRVGVQSMPQVVNPASPYWKVIAAIKDVLDPDGILAPGRYSL